jgi:integrase
VRHLHAALKPSLACGVRWKLIAENPAAHVELPSRKVGPAQNGRRFLTLDETRAFLALAERDKHYAAFLLAVKTALRPGELLSLRWADVDFNNRSISISRSLWWRDGGNFEFTPPKTENSERAVPVSDEVLEALRQHRRTQLEQRLAAENYSDLDLVFADKSGSPLSWKNLTRRHLKPLITAAGINDQGVSMYTLRHTGISLMLWAGVDVITVARITGTSVAMIDATYGHILQALQRTAIDRVTALLAAQG